MAREHARISLSIWDDDDFRALSPAAQHLYFVLTIHPALNYAGVTDWRPGRLAKFAGAWTSGAVEIAAEELSEQRFVQIDEDTEEALLRSFVRHDGLMDGPNMAVAVVKAYRSISSPDLRGIVVHELTRLKRDKPALKGWPKASDLLDKPSLNPSQYPSFKASGSPSLDPLHYPSRTGQANGSANPSGNTSVTPAPNSQLPAPDSQLPKTEDQDLGEERPETFDVGGGTELPRCSDHRGVEDPPPCRGCAKARERAEHVQVTEQVRTARAADRRHLDGILAESAAAAAASVPRPDDTR